MFQHRLSLNVVWLSATILGACSAGSNGDGVASSGGGPNPSGSNLGGSSTGNSETSTASLGSTSATLDGSGGATLRESVPGGTNSVSFGGATNAIGGQSSSSATAGAPSQPATTAGGVSAAGGVMTTGGGVARGGATTGGLSATGLGGTSARGGNTGNGGRMSSGGTSLGSTSLGGASNVAGNNSCPVPADAPASAVTAVNTVNAARLGMGIACDALVPQLITSASAHCSYYTTNKGATGGCDSAASPHSEVSGCPLFTGADVGARIRAAGYSSRGYSECMAFLNNPSSSVTTFINSVYHRTPVLSPWMRDMGYGAAAGCDTIDFGTGATTPNTVVAVYPYPGQTGIPLNFNGKQEGPTPPAPASGWPSGYPVTVYAQGASIDVHQLIEESSQTQLSHQFLTPATDPNKALSNANVLYGDAPLKAATTYRVIIQGTQSISGVTTDLQLSWTFTTR